MQLGSVKEVVELCKLDKCLIPTLDFGHINAVTGGTLKTSDDYRKILDYVYNELGEFKAKNLPKCCQRCKHKNGVVNWVRNLFNEHK